MNFTRVRAILICTILISLNGCNKSENPTDSNDADNTPGWIEKTSMSTARFGVAACTINDKIYILGGTQGLNWTELSTVEKFDPATNAWETINPLPTKRLHLSASVLNNKIYAIGGVQGLFDTILSTVEEYDPTTNTWTQKSDMPTPRAAVVSEVIDGKIYVISGRTGFKDETGITYPKTEVVEMYDPLTDAWVTNAPIPTSRVHICGGAIDGKIYVIGGNQERGIIIEEYNPTTNTWTKKTDMPGQGRFAAAAAVLKRKIYVIGGSYGGGQLATSTVFEYTPESDTWKELPDIPIKVTETIVEVINNKIYIIGGAIGTFPYTPISTVYEYDPLLYATQ
jgi:N-acetylneuraminic acid mutarotase